MQQLSEEQIQRRREQNQAAHQRQCEKQRQKMADPEWRAAQISKQKASRNRQAQRAIERAKEPKAEKKRAPRRAASKHGAKGRTPNAEERRVMNALGALPCIACHMHGVTTSEISLHHISGRTAPDAHKKVLPLCVWHHQHAAPAEVRSIYPWLVPVHAAGSVGGKAEFNRLNKPESALLVDAYSMASLTV